MFSTFAGFFGQSLRVFFAVVLVEHGLHLTVFLVLQRFAQRKDDLRGAASVCGRELCAVQAPIQIQQQVFTCRVFFALQRAYRRQVTAAVLCGQGL